MNSLTLDGNLSTAVSQTYCNADWFLCLHQSAAPIRAAPDLHEDDEEHDGDHEECVRVDMGHERHLIGSGASGAVERVLPRCTQVEPNQEQSECLVANEPKKHSKI